MHHITTMPEWMRDGPRLVSEGVTSVEFTDRTPRYMGDSEFSWVRMNTSIDDNGKPQDYFCTGDAVTDLSQTAIRLAMNAIETQEK